MTELNLKPGYLFAVTSILLSWLSGSDGIACINCGRGAADLLICSSIVECNHDEACYVDRTLTTLGGSPQFSAGCRKVSTCSNQNSTSGDAICSECCYSDMCNVRECGSDFYGDQRSVLKCFGCDDVAMGDKCPEIAQCDKTLESCVIKHGTTGKALGCIKSATCKFLVDTVYPHQPPETWDVKCCDTNLCNWDTWNLNRTVIHPVHGGWSTWSPWSNCDVTCASGHVTRKRTCSNPAPQDGVSTCSGYGLERQNCTEPECPSTFDGGWDIWKSWSHCDVTCGQGHVARTRSCANPPPSHGGKNCVGTQAETSICYEPACPINGNWSNWSSWSGCTVTCGSGHMTQTRTCTNPAPAQGGLPCIGENSQKHTCTLNPCSVNGNWTHWSSWSHCDVTCGGGHMTRTRHCTHPAPAHGGQNCQGLKLESNTCTKPDCPVNENWTHWSSWSQCDVTCGSGHITRTRDCTNPAPAHGGLSCQGQHNETSTCTTPACPVDGNWTYWSAWSQCDVMCGSGHVTRTRTCTNPAPAYGGHVCVGETNQTNTCTEMLCPVDGNWTHWSSWSHCYVTCGTGHVTRNRDCTNPAPAQGGLTCLGQNIETSTCTKPECPVNGRWSNWHAWSSCDVTCGSGHVTRTRTCTHPAPAHGGHICIGNSSDSNTCTRTACPVNGNWTVWTDWSSCDVTCGNGTRVRSRDCTNPVPTHGGLDCQGVGNDTSACSLPTCPDDAATLGCDFDNKTLCHWSNVLITDDVDWSIQPTDPALNLTDHKSSRGSFIMLNKTSAVSMGAKAVLKSAEMPPSTGDCLQFWYTADGVDIGEITVYIHTDTDTKTRVWSLGNGHVSGWELGNATLISKNSHFHVSFEGVIGHGISGYLALDDITMVTGDCVLPVHHNNTVALIG